LEPIGNSVPERNMPFLTTREMFTIKLGNPELLASFEAADTGERRVLLESRVTGMPLPTVEQAATWTNPIAIETIEWFATMEDLGEAMAWLWSASDRPGLEPIKEILMLNPGIPLELDAWPVVAFKGGSETGVMALSWLLERGDGERFTFAVAVSDTERALDEQAVIGAVAGAFALLESA
jgi:hypothetical protein